MRKIFYSLIIVLLLSSCIGGISMPSSFYNLVSYDNSNVKIKTKKNIVINIEPIVVPAYLDRPQIITLNSEDTEFNISETNRWVEPLSDSIQRVLAGDLYSYVSKSIIKTNAIKTARADYSVYVMVNKFDGRFGDKVALSVLWSILDKNGNVLIAKNSNFTTDLTSSNYNDLVKGYSYLINQLAIEIGNKISALQPNY